MYRYTVGVRAGGGGLQPPPESGKDIIFQADATFSGRSQQPKKKKMCIILLNEKNGLSIYSVQRNEVTEIRAFFANNSLIIGWSESSEEILNETIVQNVNSLSSLTAFYRKTSNESPRLGLLLEVLR